MDCMETLCEETCGCNTPQVLRARILRVCCCELLVCDLETCQEVLVHTNCACNFRVGQCVCIRYNGAMTMSIPPQISAICIQSIPCPCCC